MLILASGSPRRAKILRDCGVEFTVVKSDAPEVSYPHDPERTVRENARAKGSAIAKCLSFGAGETKRPFSRHHRMVQQPHLRQAEGS